MKYLMALCLLLSFQSAFANYSQCDANIVSAVESKITELGKEFETKEGYKHFKIEYMGDGFFDVSYLTWESNEPTKTELLKFEVVIGGSCDPYVTTLIEGN